MCPDLPSASLSLPLAWPKVESSDNQPTHFPQHPGLLFFNLIYSAADAIASYPQRLELVSELAQSLKHWSIIYPSNLLLLCETKLQPICRRPLNTTFDSLQSFCIYLQSLLRIPFEFSPETSLCGFEWWQSSFDTTYPALARLPSVTGFVLGGLTSRHD
jgi:hypothetical protein